MLKSVMQSCYENGGEPSMLMVGPFNKTVVSGFSGIAAQRYNATGAEPTTIIGAADIYVSDFGNLSVVANRFFTSVVDEGAGSLMNNWAFLIDPDEVKLASLRPYTIESLARTGDADKRMALIEWGLQVNNEAAHGVVAGISSALFCWWGGGLGSHPPVDAIMSMRRVLDSDPATGITQWFHFDDVTGDFGLETQQDVTALIESTKGAFNPVGEREPWKGDLHKVASVPMIIYHELAKISNNFKDQRAIYKWLNDKDNRVFRTRPGRL